MSQFLILKLMCLDAILNYRNIQLPNTHACFVRYSSPIELHLRPNVSTDRPVVFIRGDLTLQRYTLYTCGVTSVAKKLEEGGGCLSMSI